MVIDGISKISIFMVLCIVVTFNSRTHAQDVSNPVCKWNQSKSGCEKDPSKMIDLLTNTDKMFALLMRCEYASTQSICNNMSQNTCIWKNNACKISSKQLINQINECFSSTFCSSNYTSCKNELQNISENSTWIDRNSFRPAPSCNDTVFHWCFSFTRTCKLMEYALQGAVYDTQAYQLVSDLRYIMGVSSRSMQISLSYLESRLEIKPGNLQLYDICSDIQSRYQCESRTSSHYEGPTPTPTPSPSPSSYQKNGDQDKKNQVLFGFILTPIFFVLLLVSLCCCAIFFREKVQNVNGIQQNVELIANSSNSIEQQTQDFETAATMEIIERLPNLEFKVQKGHENSESVCCICLDKFQEGDSCTVLECAHWFHKNCLDEWIRTRGRNVSCPLCNTTLQNTQQLQQ